MRGHRGIGPGIDWGSTMAMTFEQLGALLEPLNFKRSEKGDYFFRWCGDLDAFKDDDGDFCCFIAANLAHEGRTAVFLAPELYSLKDCKHRDATLEACLILAQETKSLNYEYNGMTGEVRATVEIPLADSVLNEAQVLRSLQLLIEVLDSGDPVIRHTMRTGAIDYGRFGLKASAVDQLDRDDLVKQLGGIEKLRDLARGQNPDQG